MRAAVIIAAVMVALAMVAAGGGNAANEASTNQPVGLGAFMPGAVFGLDPEQRVQATIAMQVADEELADEPEAVATLARLSMTVSALGESGFRVIPNGAGSGYCGVFQADPANIPCNDTKEQARRFHIGGKGFQSGGAIHMATANPDMSPGTIATKVEASGEPGSFYDAHRPQAEQIIAAWQAGGGEFNGDPGELPDVGSDVHLTPKQIVDRYVLPIARASGVPITAAQVEVANDAHSVTTADGGISDHKGPPGHAWAADMSNNWVTTVGTPQMTRLAASLAKVFAVPGWLGSGLMNNERARIGRCFYRFQLIYLTGRGGNHYNHVHFGVRLLGC